MLEGRYSVAVSPEGAVTLPPPLHRDLTRMWGGEPELLCFGVQFAYLCRADDAQSLLMRLDRQLCAAFEDDMRQVNVYFRALERSVARAELMPDGHFALPPTLRALLGMQTGGVLTLLGVEDHLELWEPAQLDAQSRTLERKAPDGARPLLETPICLREGDACSFLRGGLPEPRRCGPCVWLRVP